jgi:hypothetical protein
MLGIVICLVVIAVLICALRLPERGKNKRWRQAKLQRVMRDHAGPGYASDVRRTIDVESYELEEVRAFGHHRCRSHYRGNSRPRPYPDGPFT